MTGAPLALRSHRHYGRLDSIAKSMRS